MGLQTIFVLRCDSLECHEERLLTQMPEIPNSGVFLLDDGEEGEIWFALNGDAEVVCERCWLQEDIAEDTSAC